MTKFEKKAALAVAAATVGVIVSGVALLRKHNKYLAKKAAATFGPDDGMDGDFCEVDEPKACENTEAEEAAKQRKLKRLQRQHQVKLTRMQQRKIMRQGQLNQRRMMKVK